MTVIAAYYYDHGRRIREISLGEKVLVDAKRSDFCWIGLVDPSKDELAALQEAYGLNPLAVAHALDPDRPPALNVYNHELFVVAKTAELDGDHIRYGQTAIFVGTNHIISIRHGTAAAHGDLREQLESAPALLGKGADYVLHAILHHIVDKYLPIFEVIEDQVLDMERQSLDAFLGRKEVKSIFLMRCQLTRFQRTLGAMAEVVLKLVRGHYPCVRSEARPYFNDVLDHVNRVQSMVDGLLGVLRSVFEFSNLLEQQRTGAITRKLAGWAAILAAPTMLAAIYGMNFWNLPFLTYKYGYIYIVTAMAVFGSSLFWRFRRLKWL